MPSIIRSAMFLTLSAITVLSGEAAAAGVGVTSATDGEPLGRPPAAVERVLRVGIDVEPNERVTTSANDRAHVVFLDGTSITVGPNSVLTIDKFVFDPNTAKGDMGVTLTKGMFRLVGGKISKSNEITIGTPAATIGIRGGIVTVAVTEDGKTKADFLYGDRMRVTAQGVTQAAQRPGSRIEAEMQRAPSPPAVLPSGALSATTKSLEKPAVTSTVSKAPAPASVSTSIAQALGNSKPLTSKVPQGFKGSTAIAGQSHRPASLHLQKAAQESMTHHHRGHRTIVLAVHHH